MRVDQFWTMVGIDALLAAHNFRNMGRGHSRITRKYAIRMARKSLGDARRYFEIAKMEVDHV